MFCVCVWGGGGGGGGGLESAYESIGEIWGWYKMTKMDIFRYFSINHMFWSCIRIASPIRQTEEDAMRLLFLDMYMLPSVRITNV